MCMNAPSLHLHIVDDKELVELKPLANGHAKTSRSGSIMSILSNGTTGSNGVLKNNKPMTMSPENLKRIDNAFTTNRDEYENFDASMAASAPKLPPTIVAEDVNSEKKTTLFSPEENEGDSECLPCIHSS